MYSHVVVGTNDLERAKKFYDAVFATLGVGEPMVIEDRIIYAGPGGMFMVTKPIDGKPATHANGGTVAFAAPSTQAIDAWHAAGVANGGKSCEDPPGFREMGGMKMYLAYLRDPDNNKLCTIHR